MTSTTIPQRRPAWRGRLVGALAAVALAAGAAIVYITAQPSTTAPTVETTTVVRAPVVASVAGTGAVAAARSVDLPFQASGTVVEVLVTEGDAVVAGQVLARLDDRTLRSQLASAEAGLASAQVQLDRARRGGATPEEIAAQRAAVASAEATLAGVRSGNVTAADIASAEASLRSAQARLDALRNPTPAQFSAAELLVSQAESNLETTRDSASQTKTNAQIQLVQATSSLTQAQATYATALTNWTYVRETGNDPIQPETAGANGQRQENKLTDGQQRTYFDQFVQAEAALRSAEQAVAQAQVAYETALRQEPITVRQAERQLADARTQLEALRAPAPASLAEAQAAVDQARASLQKLRQGGTATDIAAAQASVDQARANLAALTAPAAEPDQQVQAAAVEQAEQTVEQARLALEAAALRAPFAGVVTAIDIAPGSSVGASTPAVSLLDRATLHVDLRLSETDAAQVALGQPVTLAIDALPGWAGEGAVTYIAPAAETTNNVVTYPVRVSFPDADPRVLVGMTASLSIVTGRAADALVVPNSALLPRGAGRVVQVQNADGSVTEVEVQAGLTDGTVTEVRSGLVEGARVVTRPAVAAPAGGGLFGS